MSLRVGDIAPDLTSDSTAVEIDVYEWAGDNVIIPPAEPNDEASKFFPQGWDELRTFLRLTKIA